MIEPIYTYVKGKGWVIGPSVPRSPEFTYRDGKRYVLENRKPNPGERWNATSNKRTQAWDAENNAPYWSYWMNANAVEYRVDDSWLYYVTWVPLD